MLHAVADQIEAQRAGKKFWDRSPPYLRVFMTVDPPPFLYLKVWICHWQVPLVILQLIYGQVSFESFLPSKKIHLFRSRTGLFLTPVTPCFDNLPVVCIPRSLRIQSSRSDSRYLCSNPVRECYRRNWTLGTGFLRLSAFLLYAIRMNYDQTDEKKLRRISI